jgi:hypothetical protein
VNAFILIIVHFLTWFLAFAAKLVQMKYELGYYGMQAYYFFYLNLPIIVFLITVTELNLLTFYQFSDMRWNADIDIMSGILSIVSFLYQLGFLGYMINVIHFKDIYSMPEERKKFAIITYYFKHSKLSHRCFFTLLILKKMFCNIILVFLYNYPDI